MKHRDTVPTEVDLATRRVGPGGVVHVAAAWNHNQFIAQCGRDILNGSAAPHGAIVTCVRCWHAIFNWKGKL